MSEIRENQITGDWVIIAPERAKRGGNLAPVSERVEIPPFLAGCPFCQGNEAEADVERFRLNGDDGRWVLRSLVNKFSVLSPTGEVGRTDCAASGGVSVNGVGLHEVLIESPRHDVTMAFIPRAALSPYHLWIFPKAHAACFSEQGTATLTALAEVLRAVLAKVHGMLANPPLNLVIRSLGPQEANTAHFHWYISVVPRVNKTAGFELGTGMYVNPSSPESCAQALREF